jgi:hypothetical protein
MYFSFNLVFFSLPLVSLSLLTLLLRMCEINPEDDNCRFVETLESLQHSARHILEGRRHNFVAMTTIFTEIVQLAAKRKDFDFLGPMIFINFRLKCSVSYCLVSYFLIQGERRVKC